MVSINLSKFPNLKPKVLESLKLGSDCFAFHWLLCWGVDCLLLSHLCSSKTETEKLKDEGLILLVDAVSFVSINHVLL